MAVLGRINKQLKELQSELLRHGIKSRLIGEGFQLIVRKESKDILAYLQLLVGRGDSKSGEKEKTNAPSSYLFLDQALNRVINEPKRGIGEKELDQIADWLRETREGEEKACRVNREICRIINHLRREMRTRREGSFTWLQHGLKIT